MKLKPFDLGKALAGEGVVTRDGEEVTELYYFVTAIRCKNKLFAIIRGEPHGYDETGKMPQCDYENGKEYGKDLFMVPKVTTYWANVYKMSSEYEFSSIFCREELAKEYAEKNPYTFIKTISFEIEIED